MSIIIKYNRENQKHIFVRAAAKNKSKGLVIKKKRFFSELLYYFFKKVPTVIKIEGGEELAIKKK